MRRTFKLIMVIFSILLITGCSNSAIMAVEEYLGKYNSMHEDVVGDMNNIISSENLSDENKETYKSIFQRQYTDMTYKIVSEEYDGDEATITTQVTVYDFYKVQNDSAQYLADNPDKFVDDMGLYDSTKYIKYKLDQMSKTMDTIQYTIDFYVVKTSDGWKVSSLSKSDLEKLHGIYNYES